MLLLDELAAQHHDGAQVAHGRREAQLADECAAPLGRFERQPAEAEQADDDDGGDDWDGDQRPPVVLERPDAQRADGAEGRRHLPRRVSGGPGDEPGPGEGGDPAGQAPTAGQVAGPVAEEADEQPGHGTARRPRQQGAGQAPGRQLTGDGPGHRARERGEADLAQRRDEQQPAADRPAPAGRA